MDLRAYRLSLGISQSRLARLSGVSRFKLCVYELGSGSLTPEELTRIKGAFEHETARLSAAVAGFQFPSEVAKGK
jgi:transcriptional regulator with XRE-family HTH domain